jgi:hypothetical protein
MSAAMFACVPLWGWTLAASQAKSAFARSRARFSTVSTCWHPP